MARAVCTTNAAGNGPPNLLDLAQPGFAATVTQTQSLQNLEQAAVAATLQDHGLTTGDATAVQSRSARRFER